MKVLLIPWNDREPVTLHDIRSDATPGGLEDLDNLIFGPGKRGMTTVSTICSMLPVALGSDDGSEWRSPMGIISIGGLFTSTFLTLLVVPVVYTVVDEAPARLGRLIHRLPARLGWRPRACRRRRERPHPCPLDRRTDSQALSSSSKRDLLRRSD